MGTATVSLISSSAEQNLKDDRPGQEEAERVTEHQSTVVGNGLAEEKLTEIAEVRETTHRIEQTEDDIVKESLVVENVHTNGFTRTEIISNQVNTTFIVDNQR